MNDRIVGGRRITCVTLSLIGRSTTSQHNVKYVALTTTNYLEYTVADFSSHITMDFRQRPVAERRADIRSWRSRSLNTRTAACH
jgi:hypothetical protein